MKSLSHVRLFGTPMDCSLPGSSVHWDFPSKSTGVGCHFLLQEIFPTQGSNPGLLKCRQTLYHLSHQGSPKYKSRLYLTRENYVAELIDKWTSLLSLVFWFLLLVNLISHNDLRKCIFQSSLFFHLTVSVHPGIYIYLSWVFLCYRILEQEGT